MSRNGERIKKLNELYSKYGKEEVLLAIEQVNERNKDILKKYFGLTKEGFFSVKEISKIYKTTEINIYKLIENEIDRIEKWLINPEISMELINKNKTAKFASFLKKHGKEKVLEEINKLNEKDKMFICCYYQLNIGDLKFDRIKEFTETDKKTVYFKVKKILENIEHNLTNKGDIRKAQRNSKLEELYKTCGKERLKYYISNLTTSNRQIMELYLGIGTDRPKTPTEISEITGLKVGSINTIVWENTKKLEEIHKNPDLVNGKIHAQRVGELKRLYQKYGKEEFDKVIQELNEMERNMIFSYYGINCKKALSIVDIAAKYNVNEKETFSIIRKTNYYIEKTLKMREEYNIKLRQEYLITFSKYDMGDVLWLIELFESKERGVLNNFLGIEGKRKNVDEIAENYNMSTKEVTALLKKTRKEILEIMDNTPFEIRKLMHIYGKTNVIKIMDRLSEEEKKIINDYKNGIENHGEYANVVKKLSMKLNEKRTLKR